MTADNQSLRSLWTDFLASLRMQLGAALAVGLPEDESARPRGPEADGEGDDWGAHPWSVSSDMARRYRDDSPGYVTRNGRGSLEVGAFRDDPDD